MNSSFDGKLIVVTAPSGAGKTTLVKYLLKNNPTLAFSISATTREQRYSEINGMDYYFITVKEFKDKAKSAELLEWQEVYDNQYYGTLKSEVDRLWALKKHVVFDIDVKGAVNLKKIYGDKVLSIFIKPPSKEILFERLRNRQTDDEASIKKRIARATEELTFEPKFDIAIVNDDLTIAQKEIFEAVKSFLEGI
jgi:guanylate kinase